MVHRKGTLHTNADGLSRRPCSQCGREANALSISQPISVNVLSCITESWPGEFLQKQQSDIVIRAILQAKQRNIGLDVSDSSSNVSLLSGGNCVYIKECCIKILDQLQPVPISK